MTATGLTATSADIKWTAGVGSVGEIKYNVYEGPTSKAEGVTALTYKATGLTAETEYTYSVEAVNSEGLKSDKVDVTFTTLAE